MYHSIISWWDLLHVCNPAPPPSHPPWCLRPNNSKVMLDRFLSLICRLGAYLQQRRKIIITQEKHVPKFRLAPNFFVLLVKAEQETNESGCCLQNKWIFMDKFPINAFKLKAYICLGGGFLDPEKLIHQAVNLCQINCYILCVCNLNLLKGFHSYQVNSLFRLL